MATWRRALATSSHPVAKAARNLLRAVRNFSLPLPGAIFRPPLLIFLAARSLWYFVLRVFVCEPFFKAYCRRYGRNVHTGVYLHWIQGQGDIILGDDVLLDGKVSIGFAARFTDRPTLEIGSRSGLGHGCSLVIGKRITIGNDCLIGPGVTMRDSSGHSSDPEARKAGEPPAESEVRPVKIFDNVWLGAGSYVGPGVTVGEGSIVAAHAVVLSDVAPYTIVAGNPARKIGSLRVPGPVPAAQGGLDASGAGEPTTVR